MDPNQQPNGQQFYQPGQPNVPPQPPAAPYDPSLYPQYVAPQFQPTAQPPQFVPPSYGTPGSVAGTPTPVVPEAPKRSHKKLLVILIIVAVLLAGGAATALLLHKNKKAPASISKASSSTSQKATSSGFVAASKKACQLFTLSDAQKILGTSTTANSTNGTGDTHDANESVTTCGYSSGDPTVANTAVNEGIVEVTGALTAAAAAQFKADLQNLKTQYPTGTAVAGIGDDAYYLPAMQSLNIVDGNYEIIINAGSLTNGALTPNLPLAEQIAKAVVAKL